MQFVFVLVLNVITVISANSRSDVDDIGDTYDDYLTVKDIEQLRQDILKCCKETKAQAIEQQSLINGIKSFMKSEIESMKNQLYTEISNKIKEELIDVKSKQSENVNLVKYTRDGILNLTTEVNKIKEELIDVKSKQSENVKLVKYTRDGISNLKTEVNKIKEELSDVKRKQSENVNLVKYTKDGISNLTEELIDVKSKQTENVNLVKYTRDGISNLTTEVNSISKTTDDMKNQLYKEFSNKIKEDLNDLRNQQNENINLVKFTSDGLSNLTSEYRSTTLQINNEIKKIIPELNRTASNLESELSTSKESDKIETITQNQKVMSSSLNESHGAVYAQLEKINLQIMKNTNSFARAHEDIKELQIKVNDIRNSSKQTFHLANAFSEKETVYECAEYETFKTKIESSVVEVAKVCSNDETDQRLNDIMNKITSNTNLLKSILQHNSKPKHNIQNTEGDITEQYRKLNDKLTTAMEDKLSKEYLIVKRDTVQSNICNADKVITAVSELGTNIKNKFQEHKKNKRVLSAIRKMEMNLKDNLLKTCNGCNDTLQHQLDKVMKLTSATNNLLTPKPLAKPCKNSKWMNAPGDMNVCKEVVKNQLCAGNLKLAFHCCRSCTRAKQLNKDGPHRFLNEPRHIDYFYVILS